jgi:hypothetical protein
VPYFGASYPARTWTQAMDATLDDAPAEEFPEPAFKDADQENQEPLPSFTPDETPDSEPPVPSPTETPEPPTPTPTQAPPSTTAPPPPSETAPTPTPTLPTSAPPEEDEPSQGAQETGAAP